MVPACAVSGGLLGGFYAKLVLPSNKGVLGRLCALRGRYPVRFAALCGLLLAVFGLLSGNHVFGTGYEETRALLEAQPITDPSFLIWKFLANVVSYLAGIPGGLFSPSLSIGAAFAPLLGALTTAFGYCSARARFSDTSKPVESVARPPYPLPEPHS